MTKNYPPGFNPPKPRTPIKRLPPDESYVDNTRALTPEQLERARSSEHKEKEYIEDPIRKIPWISKYFSDDDEEDDSDEEE